MIAIAGELLIDLIITPEQATEEVTTREKILPIVMVF